MLDGKILAAVLATLAAFGVASGGQSLDGQSSIDIPKMDDLSPRSIGAFTGLIKEDKTTSEVTADLDYNSSDEQNLDVATKILLVENLTSVNTRKQNVDSRSQIDLHNFDGKVTVSKESVISGRTGYLVSNGVNISGEFEVQESIRTNMIKAVDVQKSDIQFEDVDGDIVSGSTSAELSDSRTDVRIKSFSGNITFNPQEGNVLLKGEVSSLKAGDVSIG